MIEALLLIATLGTLAVIVLFGFPWLAEENILFTTVREGTVKAIMRGDSFDRLIMSFEGYHLNDPSKPWYRQHYDDKRVPEWQVLYHGADNPNGFAETDDEYYDDRSPLLKYLGLYWVGFPWANSVYVYQFEWNETFTEKSSGAERVLPRAEATDFIFVSDFTYAIVTERAETGDRLPVDGMTLITVAIRNAYKALFSGEDWMRRVTAAVNRHVKDFVSSKGFDDLIAITKEPSSLGETARLWAEQFSLPIVELTNVLPDERDSPPRGLCGRYGVVIRTAELQTVDLSGTPEEKRGYQAATTRVYTANQTAEATRIEGQAEADVIRMKGEREAEALKARVDVIESSEAGQMLAQLDAMRAAAQGQGNTVIWANSPFIPKGDR